MAQKVVKLSENLAIALYSLDRGFVSLFKSQDNLTTKTCSIKVDKNYFERSVKEFNKNSGLVSDGNTITILGQNSFFKITNPFIFDDIKYSGKMEKMSNRFEKEKPGFFVYLDGKKIPDNEVIFYPSSNNCDVFLNYNYFLNLETPINVYFEYVYFSDKEYNHYYKKNFNGTKITIETSYEKDNFVDINKFKNYKGMVFVNGLLVDSNEYTLSFENNNLILNFNKTTNGDLEFFYNDSIVYKKEYKQKIESTTRVLMDIDKGTFYNLIEGPVSKLTIQFFMNGLKVPNEYIEQIGRQHYRIENSNNIDFEKYTIFIQDHGIVDDKYYEIYGSDYYLQKMIGNEKLNKGFKGNKTETVFDDFENFNVYEIMCNKGRMYNYEENSNFFNYMQRTGDDSNTKIAQIINKNPNLIKYILNTFSQRKFERLFKTNSILPESFNVGSFTEVKDDEDLTYDMFINGKYINTDMFEIEEINGKNSIKINGQVLKPDSINLLEITETTVKKSEKDFHYLKYTNEQLTSNVEGSKYPKSLIINKNDISNFYSGLTTDIIVLKKVIDDPNYLYPYSNSIGYLNVDIDIRDSNDSIIIDFKNDIDCDIIVYFKNFYYKTAFIFHPNESQDLNNMQFLSLGSAEEPLPIIPRGIPKLFVNDEYYLYGIDYVFTTPENNSKMAGSALTFIRNTPEGSAITFEINTTENEIVISKYDVDYKSKYGLLYFSKLKYPFSLDYLELYIDGIKIMKNNIQILSDKLIRVKDIEVPFTDIYLATTFNCDGEKLENVIKYYKEDNFEKIIEELFKKVDFTIDDNTSEYEPDQIYESFGTDVGITDNDGTVENNKDPNPVKPPDKIPDRTSQYVTKYIDWLTSSDARTILDSGTYIDEIVKDYFSLYNFGFGDNIDPTIVLDCGSYNLSLPYDINYNTGVDYPSKKEIFRDIIETLQTDLFEEESISSLDIYDEYVNNPVSNKYFLDGFPYWKNDEIFVISGEEDILTLPEEKCDVSSESILNFKKLTIE